MPRLLPPFSPQFRFWHALPITQHTTHTQARRCSCLSCGVVPSLLALLQGSSSGDGGACSGAAGGSSSGPSAGVLLVPAAACLRYLALAPGAAEVMAGEGQGQDREVGGTQGGSGA